MNWPADSTGSKASLAISTSLPGPDFLRYYPAHRLIAWQPQGTLDDLMLDQIADWLVDTEKVFPPFKRFVGSRSFDVCCANDLEKYRALWHENFVGWPFVSPAPVRKDHITDWITSNTSKGIKLQTYSIEQLAIQITGDVAINYYRINATWANGAGAEVRTDKLRITHTWTRPHGTWQIIG